MKRNGKWNILIQESMDQLIYAWKNENSEIKITKEIKQKEREQIKEYQ